MVVGSVGHLPFTLVDVPYATGNYRASNRHLLYLLVLVVAWRLLMGILLLDEAWGRALRSVWTGDWTVLLAHVPSTGASLGGHKAA